MCIMCTFARISIRYFIVVAFWRKSEFGPCQLSPSSQAAAWGRGRGGGGHTSHSHSSCLSPAELQLRARTEGSRAVSGRWRRMLCVKQWCVMASVMACAEQLLKEGFLLSVKIAILCSSRIVFSVQRIFTTYTTWGKQWQVSTRS